MPFLSFYKHITVRRCLLAITAVCGLSIVIALIMQYRYDMEPCPLCISQRVFILLVGLTTGIGSLFVSSKTHIRISTSLASVFAVIGGSISARHVWIQNLPEDETPLCGPSLNYMFETRPLFDALGLLFRGDGHCADVHWVFLGLSIPGWTLVLFAISAITCLTLCFRGKTAQNM